MLNTVALAGTVVHMEQKGSARKVRIAGTKWNGKTKQEEPCEVMFTTFSRRADELRGGEYVVIQGIVECREYNGKWYADVVARDLEIVSQGDAPTPQRQTRPLPPPTGPADDGFGDIPFVLFLLAMVFV